LTAPGPQRASERIQDSARELFYRQGIRAVGVDEIVSRAGVTKPSLYRTFPSKDELAADYLRRYGEEFMGRFEATIAAHPGDPCTGVLAWMKGLAERATQPDYRGCGITNAVVEYPDPTHPGRAAAEANKTALRQRLQDLARDMGARHPKALGDSLLLLMEGCYATGQLFGPGGPAAVVEYTAAALIAADTGAASL
jgi:AcrR family transcriptional regulator